MLDESSVVDHKYKGPEPNFKTQAAFFKPGDIKKKKKTPSIKIKNDEKRHQSVLRDNRGSGYGDGQFPSTV